MKYLTVVSLACLILFSSASLLMISSSGSPGIMANPDWPTFRGDNKHTGLSPFSTEENAGRLNWSFMTNGRIRTSPVTGPDGSIYFASDDRFFYALDSNGKQKWTFNVGNFLGSGVNDIYDSSPLVDVNGNVYIATDSGSMYSFTSTGTSRWKQSIEQRGQLRSSPVMDDNGIIYIGSESSMSGGGVSALYSSNGSFKWRFRTDSGIISSPVIDNDGNILFGSQEFAFYCLYPNGTLNWKETTYCGSGLIVSSASIDEDGDIYFGYYSKGSVGILYSFDSTGGYNWDYSNFRDVVYSSTAFGPDGTVYVGSNDNALYALNGADGNFKWAYQTGGKVISSPAVDSDGIIYVGSEDNYLYAINPDGSLRWKFLTNGMVHSSPAILSDGKVIVGSDDGYLYSIFKGSPSHPRSVSAKAGDGIVNLTWNEPEQDGGSPITGYSILRKESGAGIEVIAPLHTTTAYSDTEVRNGVTYQYYISAWNLFGESNRTVPVSATPMTIPDPIENLSAFNGSDYVLITWDLPMDDGGSPITSLILYRGIDDQSLEQVDEIDPQLLYINDASVENGVRYYYRMKAVNSVGISGASGIVEAMPMGISSSPRNLTAEAGDGFIQLSWDAPETIRGSPIVQYHIGYGLLSSGEDHLASTNNLSYNHTGLENGIEYHYHVVAENEVGLSDASQTMSATPLGLPEEPVNFHAVQVDLSVKLTWEVPVVDGGTPITSYIIYQSVNEGKYEFLRQLKDPEIFQFINNGVTHPNRYSYRIFSENRIGESINYAEVNITVITVPDVPMNVSSFSGDGFVILSWDAPNYDGGSPLTGFSIYREGDGTQFLLETVNADIREYNDTTAFNGDTYGYSIAAVNVWGESGRSSSVPGLPVKPVFLPDPPRDVSALYSSNRISLAWLEPLYDGGSEILTYNVYRGINDSVPMLIADLGVDVLFYIDLDVDPGHTYHYTMTSVNAAGESLHSNEAKVTIQKEDDQVPQDNGTEEGKDDKDHTLFFILGGIGIVIIILIPIIAFLVLGKKSPDVSTRPDGGLPPQSYPQQYIGGQVSTGQVPGIGAPSPQYLPQAGITQPQPYPEENMPGADPGSEISSGETVRSDISSGEVSGIPDPDPQGNMTQMNVNPDGVGHESAHTLQQVNGQSIASSESTPDGELHTAAHEAAHVIQG